MLTILVKHDILSELKQTNGGIAQLGERLPCKQEVTSSNLVISTQMETSEYVP